LPIFYRMKFSSTVRHRSLLNPSYYKIKNMSLENYLHLKEANYLRNIVIVF